MTTCEDVRPLLPDHVLGSVDATDDTEVRRHLRGCGACRRELASLREGLMVLGSTFERRPPPELRAQVLGVLADEWNDDAQGRTAWRDRVRWIGVAASLVLLLVVGLFAFAQTRRADRAEGDATSFRTVLGTLGGTGFRVGSLRPAGGHAAGGSVIAYESSNEQSFVAVFVRVPDLRGEGSLVASRPDGTTWVAGPIEFDGDGDAAAWWVTADGVGSLHGLTVLAPDGSMVATARIRPA